MLEARGVEVDRKFDLGGNLAHSAVLAGQIDLYPEYTGTAFTAILHHDPISDPKAVYDQVQKEYSQQFNLWVSQPLGFDNTFAILVRGENARRLNLKTISDGCEILTAVASWLRSRLHQSTRMDIRDSRAPTVCGFAT
jgi:glycine betaine/choline ABC-type transport system substrate-binding protein